MTIEKMRWYKIVVDGVKHIVRVDDRIMKYCVIDYYDGKLWYTGSCVKCKTWVLNHIYGHIDNNGRMVYMGRWER